MVPLSGSLCPYAFSLPLNLFFSPSSFKIFHLSIWYQFIPKDQWLRIAVWRKQNAYMIFQNMKKKIEKSKASLCEMSAPIITSYHHASCVNCGFQVNRAFHDKFCLVTLSMQSQLFPAVKQVKPGKPISRNLPGSSMTLWFDTEASFTWGKFGLCF